MTVTDDSPDVLLLPAARLHPHPDNPRGPLDTRDPETARDLGLLADSIRAQGLIHPLLVVPRPEGGHTILAGHRRHAAAVLAGLAEVPCVVRRLEPARQLELMLVENVQRADLSPLQEAQAFLKLLDRLGGEGKLGEVARRTGMTTAAVRGRLLILDLAPDVQALYARRRLPVGVAALLAGVPPGPRQVRLARLAAERGLTLDQLRALLDRGRRAKGAGAGRRVDQTDQTDHRARPGPEREAAARLLLREPARTVSFARLLVLLDQVCCACGVHEVRPELCRECPLPALLTLVARPVPPRAPPSGAPRSAPRPGGA
jgi:ParB family chromosome partitioning protein